MPYPLEYLAQLQDRLSEIRQLERELEVAAPPSTEVLNKGRSFRGEAAVRTDITLGEWWAIHHDLLLWVCQEHCDAMVAVTQLAWEVATQPELTARSLSAYEHVLTTVSEGLSTSAAAKDAAAGDETPKRLTPEQGCLLELPGGDYGLPIVLFCSPLRSLAVWAGSEPSGEWLEENMCFSAGTETQGDRCYGFHLSHLERRRPLPPPVEATVRLAKEHSADLLFLFAGPGAVPIGMERLIRRDA